MLGLDVVACVVSSLYVTVVCAIGSWRFSSM